MPLRFRPKKAQEADETPQPFLMSGNPLSPLPLLPDDENAHLLSAADKLDLDEQQNRRSNSYAMDSGTKPSGLARGLKRKYVPPHKKVSEQHLRPLRPLTADLIM